MTAFFLAGNLFFATVGLGYAARRAPIGVDAIVARKALGSGTTLAWAFTRLGYAPEIVLAYVVFAVVLELGHDFDVAAFALLGIAQIGSQLISTALKNVFDRERPGQWLKRHELSGSYPSGHSATAIVTYGGMAMLLHASRSIGYSAPYLQGVACAAIVCSCGIVWSRLVLGAHYLSDVVGGVMLGAATLLFFQQMLVVLGHASA